MFIVAEVVNLITVLDIGLPCIFVVVFVGLAFVLIAVAAEGVITASLVACSCFGGVCCFGFCCC